MDAYGILACPFGEMMFFNILYVRGAEVVVHFARVFADNEEEAIRIFNSDNEHHEIVSISPTVWY